MKLFLAVDIPNFNALAEIRLKLLQFSHQYKNKDIQDIPGTLLRSLLKERILVDDSFSLRIFCFKSLRNNFTVSPLLDTALAMANQAWKGGVKEENKEFIFKKNRKNCVHFMFVSTFYNLPWEKETFKN